MTSAEAIQSIKAALSVHDRRNKELMDRGMEHMRNRKRNSEALFEQVWEEVAELDAEFPEIVRKIVDQIPLFDPAS